MIKKRAGADVARAHFAECGPASVERAGVRAVPAVGILETEFQRTFGVVFVFVAYQDLRCAEEAFGFYYCVLEEPASAMASASPPKPGSL